MTTLDDVLAPWVPQQRWYGAKGRVVTSLSAAPLGDVLGGSHVDLVPTVVDVALEGGEVQHYQVPLSRRSSPWDDIGHALVGEADGAWFYDAPHDPDAATLLLDDLVAQRSLGPLAFHRIGDVTEGLHPRLVGVEQSNSSLVFGEEMIFKLFRRLAPGTNPDLEVTRALQDAGSPHVAPVVGWYEAPVDGTPTTLGVAQVFVASASEGWSMATASVRDLYAEVDLHADEVGGDFAGEAERLGAAVAEVHEVLREHFPTHTWSGAEVVALARAMHDRFDAQLVDVPDLAPHESSVRAAYDRVAA
ncbi:MAG: maltokinase N-terminal cap-like domain-containing protein, partial [Acidimicrobiales bacterium]